MRWPWKIEFPWEAGRQATGYLKWKLCSWEPWFDVYVLKYPVGAYILGHKDPVTNRHHFRLNIVLRHAKQGGEFWSHRKSVYECTRIHAFRPDVEHHGVTTVRAGTRYVLSIGVSVPKSAAA